MNRLTIIGLVIVAVLVLVALCAHWIAPYDVGATNLSIRYLGPSAAHWFGTDSTGRDIFSRVVFGARISLQVGIIVVTVSAVIGTFLGAIAGYYGGWVDRFVSGYVFNVFLAFPGLWRFMWKYRKMCAFEFHQSLSRAKFCRTLQRLVPDLRSEDLETGGSGVRAQAMLPNGSLVEDFNFVRSGGASQLRQRSLD